MSGASRNGFTVVAMEAAKAIVTVFVRVAISLTGLADTTKGIGAGTFVVLIDKTAAASDKVVQFFRRSGHGGSETHETRNDKGDEPNDAGCPDEGLHGVRGFGSLRRCSRLKAISRVTS